MTDLGAVRRRLDALTAAAAQWSPEGVAHALRVLEHDLYSGPAGGPAPGALDRARVLLGDPRAFEASTGLRSGTLAGLFRAAEVWSPDRPDLSGDHTIGQVRALSSRLRFASSHTPDQRVARVLSDLSDQLASDDLAWQDSGWRRALPLGPSPVFDEARSVFTDPDGWAASRHLDPDAVTAAVDLTQVSWHGTFTEPDGQTVIVPGVDALEAPAPGDGLVIGPGQVYTEVAGALAAIDSQPADVWDLHEVQVLRAGLIRLAGAALDASGGIDLREWATSTDPAQQVIAARVWPDLVPDGQHAAAAIGVASTSTTTSASDASRVWLDVDAAHTLAADTAAADGPDLQVRQLTDAAVVAGQEIADARPEDPGPVREQTAARAAQTTGCAAAAHTVAITKPGPGALRAPVANAIATAEGAGAQLDQTRAHLEDLEPQTEQHPARHAGDIVARAHAVTSRIERDATRLADTIGPPTTFSGRRLQP